MVCDILDRMDDRRKTIAALTIIIGFVVIIVVLVGLVLSSRNVVSPVPEESAIRVIFISPTSAPAAAPESSGIGGGAEAPAEE